MENTRRAQRQTSKKKASFKDKFAGGAHKVKANPKFSGGIAGGVVAVMLLSSVVGFSGTKSLDENVSVSKWAHFDSIKTVEGFSEPEPRTDVGSTPLIAKQNLGTILKNNETCTFSGQVSHVPSFNAGRGDNYLTHNYLYELTESNDQLATEFDTVKIKTDQGKVEALSTKYSHESSTYNPDTEKEEKSTRYRAVAVRVLDTLTDIESFDTEEKGLYGSDASKGLPIITLSYDCNSEDDYDEKEWKKLVGSVHVALNSRDTPEYDKVELPEDENFEEDRGVHPDIKGTEDTITLTDPEPMDESGGNENAYVPPVLDETPAGQEPLDESNNIDDSTSDQTPAEEDLPEDQ